MDVESFAALPGDVVASAELSQTSYAGSHVQLAFFGFRVKANLMYLIRPWTN
jgi:hypothetical protein